MTLGHTAAWRIVPISGVVFLVSCYLAYASATIIRSLFGGHLWGEFGTCLTGAYKTDDYFEYNSFTWYFSDIHGNGPPLDDYADNLAEIKPAPKLYLIIEEMSHVCLALVSILGFIAVFFKMRGWSSFLLAMCSWILIGFEIAIALLQIFMFMDRRYLQQHPDESMKTLLKDSSRAGLIESNFDWPQSFFIAFLQKIPMLFIDFWFVDAFWSLHLIHLCGGSGWERKGASEFPKWPRVEVDLKTKGVMGLGIMKDTFCVLSDGDSPQLHRDKGATYGTAEAILQRENEKQQQRQQRQQEIEYYRMMKRKEEEDADAAWRQQMRSNQQVV